MNDVLHVADAPTAAFAQAHVGIDVVWAGGRLTQYGLFFRCRGLLATAVVRFAVNVAAKTGRYVVGVGEWL